MQAQSGTQQLTRRSCSKAESGAGGVLRTTRKLFGIEWNSRVELRYTCRHAQEAESSLNRETAVPSHVVPSHVVSSQAAFSRSTPRPDHCQDWPYGVRRGLCHKDHRAENGDK